MMKEYVDSQQFESMLGVMAAMKEVFAVVQQWILEKTYNNEAWRSGYPCA